MTAETVHDLPEVGRGASRYVLRFRRWLVVALHLALVPAGYACAFMLRFDGPIPAAYMDVVLATLPVLVVLRLGAFASFGLFKGWWRHVGMFDLQALFKATTLSSLLFAVYLLVFGYFPGFPRSVLVLDWGIAMMAFGGVRFAVRWWREGGGGANWRLGGRRTLIIGAGNAGAHLLRRLRQDDNSDIQPVGLVDDDPNKQSLQLHGVPVLGTTRDLERLVKEKTVSLLVLAIPTASREARRRIAERCAGLKVDLKIMPDLHEMIDGRAGLADLREVQADDLLGRPQVTLDLARLRADLEDQVVLITGGAGSIGAELARQVAHYRPARLVLVEQAESPLYFVDYELRRTHPDLDIVPLVADVTDSERMERLFALHRPDYVFHAAAYKHVPMMESNVTEAVQNNIFGTLRVADAAARYGVRKFVLISTDKAVRPSSIMGATKRVAERLVLESTHLQKTRTDFRAVRFGNVLGSAGSVVPLFQRQIAEGGPVTVTHPEVTRYFMTIPEAVQLVLQAAALPDAAGQVAMLEMGEPVKILDMAENLIRLSGLEPHDDMPIVFTGMRPGEKLHEELMSAMEHTVPTDVERIRVLCASQPDGATVAVGLSRIGRALRTKDQNAILAALTDLVPEAVGPLKERYREAAARQTIRPGRLKALPKEKERDRRRSPLHWDQPGADVLPTPELDDDAMRWLGG